jgi:branched-chain amino acid transport system substrate-binding protein
MNKAVQRSASQLSLAITAPRAPRGRTVAAVSVAAIALAACSSSGSGSGSGKAYNVAFIATMSGPIGPGFLTPEARGFQAYVHAVNARGGVNGHKINAKIYDDKADAATSVTDIQQITASNVIAAFGSADSAPAESEVPFAASAKLALVVGAIGDNYVKPPRPYLFESDFPHEASAVIQSKFAQQLMQKANVAAPRVATINDIAPAGTAFANLVKKQVEGFGGKVVTAQQHQPGTTDFTAEVAAVAQSHPDIIISQSIPSETIPILKQLRQRGVKVPVVSEYIAADDSVFEQLKDPDFYAPRALAFPKDDAQLMKDAKDAGVVGDTTTEFFSHGYLEGMVLEAALKICGSNCDRAGYRDALEKISNLDTKGLTGPASFSKDKHWLVSSAKMYKWDSAAGKIAAVGDFITPSEADWLP